MLNQLNGRKTVKFTLRIMDLNSDPSRVISDPLSRKSDPEQCSTDTNRQGPTYGILGAQILSGKYEKIGGSHSSRIFSRPTYFKVNNLSLSPTQIASRCSMAARVNTIVKLIHQS